MTTYNCELCATKSGTYDLRMLCCTARFLCSLPTKDQMASTATKLIAKYGHDRQALRNAVRAEQKRRAAEAMADTANR